MDVCIPPDSQNKLLKLSRQTLVDFVLGLERATVEIEDPHLQSREYGVFVSLHKDQELRGCIGTCVPTRPLYQNIVEMTQAAASRDRRVAPITAGELDQIHIDISVLSALEIARNPLALQIGKHGLHVTSGDRRGVLLPQVATEYGWDIKTYLEHACEKAGLPKDAWTCSDTRISTFTALIIQEPA